MSLVDGILGALQPIAIFRAGADDPFAVIFEEQIIARQERRGIGANIGKDKTSKLFGFERRMADAIFECAVGGFGGLLQAAAAHVVEPAMIAAADAAIFDAAEFERCAAMGAVQLDQAEPSAAVAKQYEVLAKQPYLDRAGFRLD